MILKARGLQSSNILVKILKFPYNLESMNCTWQAIYECEYLMF